jgi:hypothetical protein
MSPLNSGGISLADVLLAICAFCLVMLVVKAY